MTTRGMKILVAFGAALLVASFAFAAQDVVTAVHGTIDKLDASTRTVAIKTSDGTLHSMRFVDKTAVHGMHAGAEGAKESFHGLTEGTEVIAHYTGKEGDATAVEIDRVGKDGLKATEGTISKLDRGGKTIAVKTADGTEHTFDLSEHAAADAGKDLGEGTVKGTKVVIYSSERVGKEVAHFFERML